MQTHAKPTNAMKFDDIALIVRVHSSSQDTVTSRKDDAS